MTQADTIYIDLIRKIMDKGSRVTGRNGKTRKIPFQQVSFNQTPLIAARKTAWKNALLEMEWFLTGSNNINDLDPRVHSWWKDFVKNDDGVLHYNYGTTLRKMYSPGTNQGTVLQFQHIHKTDDPVDIPEFKDYKTYNDKKGKHVGYKGKNSQGDTFEVIDYLGKTRYILKFSNGYIAECNSGNFFKGHIKNPYYPSVLGVGCYGIPKKLSYTKQAYSIWSGMMNRCYNKERKQYKWYGKLGIFVTSRWKCFEYFLDDISKLDGFSQWLEFNGKKEAEYHLDKDYKSGKYYGKETCVFLPKKMNISIANCERYFKTPRHPLHIDQIQTSIDLLKNEPNSRRNVLTTWIPPNVQSGLMSPTNCHGSLIQNIVIDGKIHMQMNQRSADMVLGVPHNWIQYWALLQYFAHQSGLKVGSFSWVGGDCHVYEEHVDSMWDVVEQSDKYTKYGKKEQDINLIYSPTSDTFKASDFSLSGEYKPLTNKKLKLIV